MIEAFALLLLCQLAGEILSLGLGLPMPGPVIGLLLLFAGLIVAQTFGRSWHRHRESLRRR
jgi:holin-like protein